MNPSWLLNPNSPATQATVEIFVLIMAIALVIFGIVFFVETYSISRFRFRKGQGEPKQVEGNVRLEVFWTAVPALTLLGIFIYMLQVMKITQAPPAPQPDMVIIGHQWWWEVRYPKYGIVTANEIHMPQGQRFLVETTAADVIHDLWIPQLGDKMDVVPGQKNYQYLEGIKPGEFVGQCAEFCGNDHALMLIHAYVQTPQDFEAWVKTQSQPSVTGAAQNSAGNAVFQGLPCVSCHAISGTAANGTVGPDLSHFGSRNYLATFLPNTPENLAAWLKNPQVLKPGSLMPNLGLTDDQVNELVTFLENLK